MNILYSLITFFLGTFIGSFLNVVIDRVPREESFVKGRSHCEFCKHTLYWYDLIPLFSFIFLRGRCRYCKKFIGFKYPLVELTTGITFLTLFYPLQNAIVYGTSLSTLFSLVFFLIIFSAFIVIFYTDLWSGIIPDIVLLPAVVVVLLYTIFMQPQHLLENFISALGGMFFFLVLFLGTKGRGMGLGDVKLAFFLGLLLGWPGIFLSIYIAFLTGAIAAIILILWGKKHFFGSTIPFGPFLIFGAVVSWFWGPLLWEKILTFL